MYRLVIEPNQQQDEHINLLSDQEHYLRRVLRLTKGDRFIAINGQGGCWLAELRATGAKILETVFHDNELSVAVTLMVALPKGNGFDEIVRFGTELGAHQFLPLISTRTLLRPGENKLKRWRKIALEAVEQSERQILPYIYPPMSFNQARKEITNLKADCYLAVARKNAPSLGENLQKRLLSSPPQQIVIATGPEGGWTEAEIEKAIANGFQPVSLGKRILRAITAPITAISIIVGIYER